MLEASSASLQAFFSSLERIWYFLVLPLPLLPLHAPRYFVRRYRIKSPPFMCVWGQPCSLSSLSHSSWQGRLFFFFLSRAAGSSSSQSSRGGEAEPAMEPASQPGSQSLQWSPSYSPEEPIIQERYQTMNHLHQSSPLVPSHRCAHPPLTQLCFLAGRLLVAVCIFNEWLLHFINIGHSN